MSIGEVVQRDVDAAKALFHNVEHKVVDGAREAFHEAHVLAQALENKIVELGKVTGVTVHIEDAIKAIEPVLASIASHINAVVAPEVAAVEAEIMKAVEPVIEAALEHAGVVLEKAPAPADPVAQAIMAAPPAPAAPAAPAEPPVVVPISAGGADVTA